MEESSDSSGSVFVANNAIRLVQANLQAELERFKKEIPDADFMDTSNVCENVRDKVLNCEDEPHLSKTQNNCRRICIASDLFIGICSVYECVVDYEYTKIIKTLMQWNKYKIISSKITKRIQLERKKEKYFMAEAQSKLQKHSEAIEDTTSGEARIISPNYPESMELVTEDPAGLEKDIQDKETHACEINGTLEQTLEHSTLGDLSTGVGNMTDIRAEPSVDTTQFPTFAIPREIHSFPSAVPDIPVGEYNVQEITEADINDILQALNDQITEKAAEVEQPEPLLETPSRMAEAPEELAADKSPVVEDEVVDQMQELENLEEWSLPDLEPVEKRKRQRRHLITDEVTTLRNYAQRAVYLNSNINIQRVQVFEGPPQVLEAMSVNHSMRTTGFKNSFFSDVRSEKLNRLFDRHLKVEKKPIEPAVDLHMRPAEPVRADISKVTNQEIVEEIGMRAGMQALPGRTDTLVELTKTHQTDLEIPTVGGLQEQNLIGVPISRIVTSAIEPPDLDRINTVPVTTTPRAQQLQGKTLDPDRHSSWFFSTKENPPSAKYREFNYVYKKLQEYWSLFEMQGMEKSISLKEFFHFEVDTSFANFLTVLRIADKLSLQRKLLLEYKDQDVLIKPFEHPFVSGKQLLLKAKEPLL